MDRLSPLDASFLCFEERVTPMHGGSVAVLEAAPDGRRRRDRRSALVGALVELDDAPTEGAANAADLRGGYGCGRAARLAD